MKQILVAVALTLVASACRGDDPAAQPSPAEPPSATLIGRTIEFPAGDPVRIGFRPFTGAARVIVRYEPTDAVIDLCPLARFDDAIPDRAACRRDVRSGVRETVTSPDLRAVAIVVRSDTDAQGDLVLEYEEGARDLLIGLPLVPPPSGGADCSDNACNPIFELQPTRAGAFEASASWRGPAGTLVLLQGSVLGRSQTATGIPYGEPARADGEPPLTISTRLSAPAEYALALRHDHVGSTIPPMRDVVLRARWPG